MLYFWAMIQNRLESSIRNQSNVAANEADARSRIRDADFAEESANLSQQSIIQQAAASMLLNDDCIFLVPQRNGKVRQFGDAAFTVNVTPSATTGASVTDESNTTLEISVACETMPPFYYGDIVTADGTYSGETCKLKTVSEGT